MTPTQRSLKLLRDDGWHVEIVEHYNSFTRQRKDLFGFVDLLAMKDGERILAVQTTSGSNLAARRTKILASPLYPIVAAQMDIVLHGWRKLKVKRGGKAMRWTPNVEVVNADHQ